MEGGARGGGRERFCGSGWARVRYRRARAGLRRSRVKRGIWKSECGGRWRGRAFRAGGCRADGMAREVGGTAAGAGGGGGMRGVLRTWRSWIGRLGVLEEKADGGADGDVLPRRRSWSGLREAGDRGNWRRIRGKMGGGADAAGGGSRCCGSGCSRRTGIAAAEPVLHEPRMMRVRVGEPAVPGVTAWGGLEDGRAAFVPFVRCRGSWWRFRWVRAVRRSWRRCWKLRLRGWRRGAVHFRRLWRM